MSVAQRHVKRWEHESVLETIQQRLHRDSNLMRIRPQTVEHAFGTKKY
ncbi:hypothetical protein [Salinisphaera sp.]